MSGAVMLSSHRFAATSYALRATINAVTETLTFGPVSTTTNYYLTDLRALLQTCLLTHSEAALATVTLSTSTWRLSVLEGSTVALLWADGATTLDPLLFGWTTTNTSPSTSFSAPNMPQGLWVPPFDRADDTYDQQPVVGGVGVSLSGLTRVSRFATPYQERDVTWELLTPATTRERSASSAAPYNTLEWHWENVISHGHPVRLYDDGSTVNAGTGYAEYVTRDLERPWAQSGRTRTERYDALLRLRRTS